MAELDRITEEHDRSATVELIRELGDPALGEEDRARVVYALARVSDPRAVATLVEMGRDRGLTVEVRRWAH